MPECLVRGTSGRFGEHHQNVVGSVPARHNYCFRCDDSTLYIDRPHSTGRVIALHLWERFLSAALETLNVTVTRNQGIWKNQSGHNERESGRRHVGAFKQRGRQSHNEAHFVFSTQRKKTKTKDWRRSLGFTAVKKNKENKNKIKQNKRLRWLSRWQMVELNVTYRQTKLTAEPF